MPTCPPLSLSYASIPVKPAGSADVIFHWLFPFSSPGSNGPDPKKWQQVDQLLKKDQTASAGKLVDELYRAARQRQDTPEYLRALLYKLRLLEAKEENADVKSIALVEADLKTAKFPARPILHSLLAQLYAQYYDAHRYELYDRTVAAPNAADASAADIQTWDAARLGSAVVQHFRASLQDEPQRQQKLLLNALGYAVTGGTAEGRQLRPTLYDLLAHRAMEGLGNDELYLTTPAVQFELQDPTLFGPATDFARLPLVAPAADSLNGQFHALQALQQLTAFRLTDAANPAALADVTLKRLLFVHQHAVVPDKDVLYRAALAREAVALERLPISTEFLVAQAQSLELTEPAQAREIALQAEKRFPKSRGAQMAQALRQRIEAVQVSFTAEEVVLPSQPWLLKLQVRNAPKLYAKAYRVSNAYNVRLSEPGSVSEPYNFEKLFAQALAKKPVAAWEMSLAGPEDYRPHSVQQAGKPLPLGFYLIVVSTAEENPTRERKGLVTTRSFISVSELSYVQRNEDRARQTQLLLAHRQSGSPLPAVKVLPLFQYYDAKARTTKQRRGPAMLTDADGQVRIPMLAGESSNTRLSGIFLTRAMTLYWLKISTATIMGQDVQKRRSRHTAVPFSTPTAPSTGPAKPYTSRAF
ncbi:hypothetical protein [Hymenobacter cellulosilyticus]|uniref:Macroglobulin domain-containing protein n=1 Tax=Hymenobacter cellulosilyticus TaxID=2932248 RepID=A0A8T9Q3Z9_9BACT|nr:hypothetical protein [Hymenobacter cellulosilyticus]UOQ72294.1 hypothetical protein MUN79_27750 [Hymenobacter cellulosilyticus]